MNDFHEVPQNVKQESHMITVYQLNKLVKDAKKLGKDPLLMLKFYAKLKLGVPRDWAILPKKVMENLRNE